MDFLDGAVGFGLCFGYVFAECADAEYAAAGSYDFVSFECGAGVEDLHMWREIMVQSADDHALWVVTRIAAGRHDYAEAGAAVPQGCMAVELSVYGSQAQFRQGGLQAHQDRLRFRVTETYVVLEHLDSAIRSDHQAGVQEPCEG